MMNDYRDKLKNSGYTTYSNYVDSYLKGGFGSGFIYVAPDGTNYLITNHHVVPHASTVSVEFEDSETGLLTKYEGLKVLVTDDELDIAICSFPDGKKPFKTGLNFNLSPLQDGDEVYTAGFPGLGSEPVWQFGKGIVTNSRARIKDLIDPSISYVIQHSAQVDSGNSGGPLLVKDKRYTSGYAVVGVNTWKATRRDSTNFSIPAKVISDFITKNTNANQNVNNDDEVKTRAEKFIKNFEDKEKNYTDIAKFISYDYAIKNGKDAFLDINNYAPTNVRNTILGLFAFDPLEGLKYSLAYTIFSKYRSNDVESRVYTIDSFEKTENNYKVVFKCEELNSIYETEWISEHGLWRIASNVAPKGKNGNSNSSKSNKNSRGKTSGSPSTFQLDTPKVQGDSHFEMKLGSSVPLNPQSFKRGYFDTKPSLNINLDFFVVNFWGLELGYDMEFLGGGQYICFPYIGSGFRVPINCNSMSFIPFVMADLGVALYKAPGCFTAGFGLGSKAEAGIEFEFNCGTHCYPAFGLSYMINYLIVSSPTYANGESLNSQNGLYFKHGINLFVRFGI